MNLKYNECRNIIKEADVLLFRCERFPGIGWWIGCYTQSPYSHIGLAHWDNDRLYCLEFREFKGARKYLVSDYIKEGNKIDLFRVFSLIRVPTISGYIERLFSDVTADLITEHALELIDQHRGYSWKIIWKIARTYIPFVRLFRGTKITDTNGNIYVCSTLITKLYREHYIDPVPFLADDYTKPGDIARSAVFQYLFRISY